jgi:hypothetical protein
MKEGLFLKAQELKAKQPPEKINCLFLLMLIKPI